MAPTEGRVDRPMYLLLTTVWQYMQKVGIIMYAI